MKRRTIKDIAKESGFSLSTVSLVLNNHPRISQATRDRVMAVVKKYNFYPNSAARGLASELARSRGARVFVTLGPEGLLGALPDGSVEHVPALPLRGPIDIVGAGDAVSANLACALAAGASLREALKLAGAAASVVIHKIGTTGAAAVGEIAALLCKDREAPR